MRGWDSAPAPRLRAVTALKNPYVYAFFCYFSFVERKVAYLYLKDVKTLILLDDYKQQIAASVQTLKEAGDSL